MGNLFWTVAPDHHLAIRTGGVGVVLDSNTELNQ
jgi:hypothetical protein